MSIFPSNNFINSPGHKLIYIASHLNARVNPPIRADPPDFFDDFLLSLFIDGSTVSQLERVEIVGSILEPVG